MPAAANTTASKTCEREAIEQVKKGNPAGMASLYELYQPRIYSLCLRYTSNAFDAEDLTQDIFIHLLRKIGTFRGEADFRTWLYKVVLNAARLFARRLRRQREVVVNDSTEDALGSAESLFRNPVHRIALTRALSSLTPVRRTAFLLHDVQGLTHNEVASRLGVTVVASKSRLHRAHIAIRNILASRNPFVGPMRQQHTRSSPSNFFHLPQSTRDRPGHTKI